MLTSDGWSYRAEGSRDLRLDYLRGLCLIKMVFNHLFRTPLHALNHWIGFVTAAEGFFFISGVVVGIVHTRRSRERGLAATSRQVLTRSAQLYLANLALVFLFVSLETAGWLGYGRFDPLWAESFRWTELFGFGQPYFLHVLPRYVVFLALTPLALWALVRGRGGWVLAVSFGLWALNQALGGGQRIPGVERSGFPLIAWQLLFFAGMWLGDHRDRAAELWRRVPTGRRTALLAIAFLGFVLYKQAAISGWLGTPTGRSPLFDRDDLGPLRLINLAIAFAFFFDLVDRLWKPLARWTGRFVLPIGQSSLYVFLMHIPLAWLARELMLRFSAGPPPAAIWRLLGDLLVLALLWLAVRRRFLFRLVPT